MIMVFLNKCFPLFSVSSLNMFTNDFQIKQMKWVKQTKHQAVSYVFRKNNMSYHKFILDNIEMYILLSIINKY